MEDMKLYNYREEYQAVLDYLEQSEDLTYEDLKDTLEAIQLPAEEKIANTGKVIQKLNDDLEVIKNRQNVLKDLKDRKAKEIENLKSYLLFNMQQLDIKKVEQPDIKVSTRKSNSLVINDESKLPKEFVKEEVTVKPDKAGFKKYYSELSEEEKEKIDYAYLAENHSIQIK